MGRFQDKYTNAQKEVVARAVVHDGMSARQAIEAAARGELGLPAFDMRLSSAQEYARKYKRAQEELAAAALARRPLGDVTPELLARIAECASVAIDKLTKAPNPNPSRLAAWVRLLGDMHGVERKLQPEQPKPQRGKAKGENAQPEPAAAPSLVDKLAALEGKQKRKRGPEQNNTHPLGDEGEHQEDRSEACAAVQTDNPKDPTQTDQQETPVTVAPPIRALSAGGVELARRPV